MCWWTLNPFLVHHDNGDLIDTRLVVQDAPGSMLSHLSRWSTVMTMTMTRTKISQMSPWTTGGQIR